MKLKWTEDLSSGIKEIDSQHKELLNRVNLLLEASRKGKGKEEISHLLLFLKDYAEIHFSDEEKHMIISRYSDYQHHKNEHQQFIHNFSDIEKEFDIHGASSYFLIQIQKWMCSWIKNHLFTVDKKMCKYFKTIKRFKY
jgi:hemerythrin